MRSDIYPREMGVKKGGETKKKEKERKRKKKSHHHQRESEGVRERKSGRIASAALFHCVVSSLMTPFSHARARVVARVPYSRSRLKSAPRSHALSRRHHARAGGRADVIINERASGSGLNLFDTLVTYNRRILFPYDGSVGTRVHTRARIRAHTRHFVILIAGPSRKAKKRVSPIL